MAQSDRKKNQIIAIGLVGGVVLVGFILMGALLNNSDPTGGLPSRSSPTVDETIISDRTAAASPEMSWITSGRLQMERLTKETEELRQLLDQARKEAQNQSETIRQEYDELLIQQTAKIAALEAERANTSAPASSTGPEETFNAAAERPGADLTPPRASGPGSDFVQRRPLSRTSTPSSQGGTSEAPASTGGNFGQSFTLAALEQPETDEREIRRLGNYLPAGSYAPAVVLSGADAATNVSNRDNPIPVLFRITGSAVTAALGKSRPARVNLKGCTVQGSATGDLSSERVKVRLISMTCVNGQGDILETKVAGYMAGSGKEGVRGKVVSREGPAVTNAMIAGALGGLGKGISAAGNASISQENASVDQILRGAGVGTLAGGAENAATTLADYYIKRAEQYQPVVSLYGGTKVELVFLEGVELGQ
ncbi:TrbI/VirB10 family protein [Tritonibacter sp. SIMBA_163]|uniref:TrbI/VirB10 family protein n=1 Tax=Tritonibacter sp. SIMBA_163 TaxID=3080868 RepID=UPI003980E58A